MDKRKPITRSKMILICSVIENKSENSTALESSATSLARWARDRHLSKTPLFWTLERPFAQVSIHPVSEKRSRVVLLALLIVWLVCAGILGCGVISKVDRKSHVQSILFEVSAAMVLSTITTARSYIERLTYSPEHNALSSFCCVALARVLRYSIDSLTIWLFRAMAQDLSRAQHFRPALA